MEKAKVYLFTSPTCSYCPSAKRFLGEFKRERDDFDAIELSTATPEGQKKAQKYNVMSVPTFIIRGPAFPDPIGLRGNQNAETMNKYLDIALGIKTLEDFRKPTLRDKLQDGISIGRLKIKF